MPNPLTPRMIRNLKVLADPSLSPDGSKLAYTLEWIDHSSMQVRSRIMLADVGGSHELELTRGRQDQNSKFSPDGSRLAFLRPQERGEGFDVGSAEKSPRPSPVRQLWILPLTGGEARQLTATSHNISDFSWSPDGKSIVFCAQPAPTKESSGPLEPVLVNRMHYRHDTLGWRGDGRFHLFRAEIASGEILQLTDGDWDDTGPVWSPDGRHIAFVSGRKDDRDIRSGTEAYVVSSQGGQPQLWSGDLAGVGSVTWSHDGSQLLVVASEWPGYMVAWQGWLYVLDSAAPPRRLTDDTFRPVQAFPHWSRSPEIRWTADGRILLLGDRRGESFLLQTSPRGEAPKILAGGGAQSTALALDSSAKTAVILSSSPKEPSTLQSYRLNPTSIAVSGAIDPNWEYLRKFPPAAIERIAVSRGEYELDCRLFFPPDFNPSSTYPLVLDIHGGPNGAFYDSFVSWQQMLATHGFLTLAINPRGSSTYGDDFMMAVLGDWGGEDYLDLIAAMDFVCQRPYVDGSRLGVHGYSYGGYMTSWVIGHTRRFRAAVVGAPCVDLLHMYGTSDIGVTFGEDQWAANPTEWDGPTLEAWSQKLLTRSPITYAPSVETPVLLLHGEADLRCPISQSEAYFTLLKRLGKEVEMVRFPGCNHLFLRSGSPTMREGYLEHTLAWFQKYL